MIVNQHQWEQLRECCRNDVAFAQLQEILNLKLLPCYQSLSTIIERINQCLELETLLQTATRELQNYLNVDRVAIVQWYPQAEEIKGKYIAETVLTGFP